MSDDLEKGFQRYMSSIGDFNKLEKIELSMMLARLCVLEPHLPGIIEREMRGIRVVKNYVKQQIEQKNHEK